MSDRIDDPYTPPAADLLTTPTSRDERILQFPRFSTWAVLGLAIITLGLYALYWLWSRTLILNRVLPERAIPLWFCVAAVALGLLNAGTGIAEGYNPQDPELAGISALVNLATQIWYLVWAFKFRNRLHTLVAAAPGTRQWGNPIATFFLQVFHLSYKVNQYIDEARTRPRQSLAA